MVLRGQGQLAFAGAFYVIGVLLVTAVWLMFIQYDTLRAVDNRLLAAVRELPSLLPEDFHDRTLDATSISRAEDQKNLDRFSSHARLGGFAYLYTYIVRDGKIYFTASSFDAQDVENNSVSYYWTPYPEGDQAYFRAYSQSAPVFVTASDRWGSFRTVLLAMQTANGSRFVAGADVDISNVNAAMWNQLPWVIGAAFMLLVFTGPIGLTMRRALASANMDLARLNAELQADITERSRVEVRLRAATERARVANESKSRFLANISHEMRTPLNGINGMTDLLLDTRLDASQQELAQRIQICGQALLETIHHVIDVASIESGKVEFAYKPINVRHWLDQHIPIFSIPMAKQRLELAVDISASVPACIHTDPERLWQILGNLISNAIKYTQAGGVQVRVAWAEDTLTIEVEDTGMGIPEQFQATVFEAFVQADTSATRRFEGAGLGLTLAKDLCKLMDGRLWLERSSPEGSLFCLSLTAIVATDPDHPQVALPIRYGVPQKIAILTQFVPLVRQFNQILNPFGIAVQQVTALENLTDRANQDVRALIIDSTYGLDALHRASHLIHANVMMIWLHWIGETIPALENRVLNTLCKPLTTSAVKTLLGPVIESSPTAVTASDRHFNNIQVLVAEDNEVNMMIIMRMLKQAGMQADMAKNGLEAVLAVRKKQYDLILMDVQMPEMDGLEATRTIIAEKGDMAPVIVGVSAHATGDHIALAHAAGMTEYLTKPLKKETLYEVLERVFCQPAQCV